MGTKLIQQIQNLGDMIRVNQQQQKKKNATIATRRVLSRNIVFFSKERQNWKNKKNKTVEVLVIQNGVSTVKF